MVSTPGFSVSWVQLLVKELRFPQAAKKKDMEVEQGSEGWGRAHSLGGALGVQDVFPSGDYKGSWKETLMALRGTFLILQLFILMIC